MKKLTLSILAVSLLAGSSVYADDTQELKDLRLEIEKLKAQQAEDTDELWEVIDKVETKAFTDKLNMSFELRGRMDNFKYNNNGIGNNIGKAYDPTAAKNERREMAFPQEKNWGPQYSVKGLLNMNAKMDNGTKFTGRIRFDHSSQGDQRICILSPQDIGAELPASSTNKFTTFDVDRAFVDVPFLGDSAVPLVVSAGILPTTGGMSSNIIENTPRRSVFPTLIFDSNVYGGILTANFSKLIGTDVYLRGIAGKAYTLNNQMFYYQCNREDIQNDDVAGIFLEVKVPLFDVDNTLWIGYNHNGNIKATPFLGGDGAENKGSNTALKYQQDLGSIANYGAGWELRDIAFSESSGTLDLFAHGSVSDPEGNGNCVNYTGTDGSSDCNVGVDANPNPYYDSEMARGTLLTDIGYGIYTGVKYTAPWEYATKFGYEFNKGSASWWSATQGSEDVFNKLATRGNVNEVYVSQDITSNVYVRVGYMNIQEKYTGSGWHFGTPLAKDATQENVYMLFNAYF